jgi:hypothetical protein
VVLHKVGLDTGQGSLKVALSLLTEDDVIKGQIFTLTCIQKWKFNVKN